MKPLHPKIPRAIKTPNCFIIFYFKKNLSLSKWLERVLRFYFHFWKIKMLAFIAAFLLICLKLEIHNVVLSRYCSTLKELWRHFAFSIKKKLCKTSWWVVYQRVLNRCTGCCESEFTYFQLHQSLRSFPFSNFCFLNISYHYIWF